MGNPVVLQGLLDNKREYTDHLSDVLCETLLQEFADGYDRIRQNPARRGNVLNLFQSWLAEIPEWNAARVRALYQSVSKRSGCAYIGELVKGILITCVKVQVVSHGSPNEDSRKIKLRVPSAENFTHACAIAAARSFWKRPYLFYHEVRSLERQHNLVQAEALIKTALKNTLRSYLPMDQLMRVMPSVGGDMPPDPVISESEGDTSGDDEDSENEDGESGDEESGDEDGEGEGGDEGEDDGEDEDEETSEEAPDSYVDVAKAPAPLPMLVPVPLPLPPIAQEPEPESYSDSDSEYESEPEPESAPAPVHAPVRPAEPLLLREPESESESGSDAKPEPLDVQDAPAPFAPFGEADYAEEADEAEEVSDADSLNMSDIERIVEDPDAGTLKKVSIDSDNDSESEFSLHKDGAEPEGDAESEPEAANLAQAPAAAAAAERVSRHSAPDVRVIPLQNMLVNRARLQKVRIDKTRLVRPAPSAGSARRAEGAFF